MNPMFAVLVVEREPLTWAALPSAVLSWLHAAGGFALAALAIYLLAFLLRTTRKSGPGQLGSSLLFILVGGVFLALTPHLLARLSGSLGWSARPGNLVSAERWYEELKP